MLRLLLIFFFYAIHYSSYCQASDFITVRKKSGAVIKTFVAGSPIILHTITGKYVEGLVKQIKNDSVFITTFDIRTFMSGYGVTMVDTFASYLVPIYYKDILNIKVFIKHRFLRGKIDGLLIYGGAGYFGLNIINSIYLNDPITEKGNLRNLGISVGAFGLGHLIRKYFSVNRFSSKRDKIIYVQVR